MWIGPYGIKGITGDKGSDGNYPVSIKSMSIKKKIIYHYRPSGSDWR